MGLALLLALSLIPGLSFGQSPVITIPQWGTTSGGGNASGTITVTNTFQKVFSATGPSSANAVAANRKGCTIVNGGSNNMWVTEGMTTATSVKSSSITLSSGQAYYCGNTGGTVLIGEVDITGTAGDAFYAAQW